MSDHYNSGPGLGPHSHGHLNGHDPMDDGGDSESLWDELSHQQTREIQQHQDRMMSQTHGIRHHHHNMNMNMNMNLPLNMKHVNVNVPSGDQIRHAVHQTAEALSSAAMKVAASTQTVKKNVNHVATALSKRKEQIGMGMNMNMGRGMNMNMNIYGNNEPNEHYSYTGPYASGQKRYMVDSPCREFGLHPSSENFNLMRENSFGDHDQFRTNTSANPNTNTNMDINTNTTVSSEPLLSADYGVDGDSLMMGNGHGNPSVDGSGRSGHGHGHGHGQSRGNPNAASNQEKKFVFLDNFRMAPKRDGWGAVANLDLFLTSLYSYYYHRGIVPIVGKGIVELISLFFTLWLSVFLFVYLDWAALWQCKDEKTCADNLQSYIIEKPFGKISFWNFLVLLYIILFSAYGLFALTAFFASVKDALEAKFIFEDKLGFSARHLEGGAVEWHEIVKKLLQLQHSGEYRIAIHGQDVKDELVVAQRILRRENFMIAFFNRNVLDLTIPMPWKVGGRSKTKFYSKSLEWSIYFCILSYMFNHKYQIRPAFCMDPGALQRRLIFCGIAHIVFMPFLLFFMTLHFSMQNLYDFRSEKQYLGPKEWSSTSKWIFREFNELPHVFERRIEPSYEAMEEYLGLFAPSSLMNSVGRILVFLSGSLGAVCVALAAVNDAILLHVKLGNWNLLWYVGVLGVVYSIGKGMLPDNTRKSRRHHNLFADMDMALEKVSSHTHYHPDFWKKRGWDPIIRAAVSELFQFKAQLFVMEIASIIVAPIILCHSLPKRAGDICTFVQKTKTEVHRTGDHCGFATFDFDMFGDEDWEGDDDEAKEAAQGSQSPTSASAFYAKRSAAYAQLNSSDRPKAKLGKMEKSFFNFKTVHPGWKCSSSGQDLVDRIETYQAQQAVALAHERQHHISAAARQLETLRKLEKQVEESKGETDFAPHIDETYVVETQQGGSDKAKANKEEVGMKREKSNLKVHFQDADIPEVHADSPLKTTKSNLSALASVLMHEDLGLSAELQRVLNRSTLDPGASLFLPSSYTTDHSLPSLSYLEQNIGMHSSQNDESANNNREQLLQRQYQWLDRYHSQMRSQHQSPAGDVEQGNVEQV